MQRPPCVDAARHVSCAHGCPPMRLAPAPLLCMPCPLPAGGAYPREGAGQPRVPAGGAGGVGAGEGAPSARPHQRSAHRHAAPAAALCLPRSACCAIPCCRAGRAGPPAPCLAHLRRNIACSFSSCITLSICPRPWWPCTCSAPTHPLTHPIPPHPPSAPPLLPLQAALAVFERQGREADAYVDRRLAELRCQRGQRLRWCVAPERAGPALCPKTAL